MEDGISIHWWNRTSEPEKVGIRGEVKFLDINGEILHDFDSDFGQELRFNFIIGQGFGLFNTHDGWTGNLTNLIEGKGYWIIIINDIFA